MLKPGRPSTNKSQKQKAIESVTQQDEIAEATQRFNVDIPVSLHRDMKVQAAKEGVKLNALTIKIFNEYLKNNVIE